VVSAVAKGGRISFSCGPEPVTIVLAATAKVRNTSALVVLDGGGLVTLSGAGKRRILYQDTCDQAQVWTTAHCDDQQTPKLVVQNITLADGNATWQHQEGGGGGAILVRGGQFHAYNARFLRNRCDRTGPDLGGAAIRVLDQWRDRPVYIANSTFGGAKGQGGVCANGGALSSIGVSWTLLNSVLSYNSAIGAGANPARSGTPGGGSGGAIDIDGDAMALTLDGTVVERNSATEGGGAIFFVSNDRTGTVRIARSTLRVNPNQGFQTAGYPGIFFLGRGRPAVAGSTIG
jgi:predicted outer membrane repeat protein